MAHLGSTIYLIDDDDSVRRALGRVMTFAGYTWQAFESVEDFLAGAHLSAYGCVVADMTMLGMTGINLKHLLNSAHWEIPVIFVTAHDSEEMRAAAQEAGAAGYFRKPVDTQALLDAIQWALNTTRPVQPV